MRRVGIAEIMRESGLSRATVDRVLNGRGQVHPRTREVVEDTLRRLSTPAVPAEAGPPLDVVLRLGRGLMAQVRAAWNGLSLPGGFHDMYQADEAAMLGLVAELCGDAERPLILTAKNTDRLVALLSEARARGKRVVAMVSDLAPSARDVFVGIDNRAAGQTAAFLLGRALGDRPMAVGVVLADHAFRCHEDREIGFRTALRSHSPKVVLVGEALGEDSVATTRDAVRRLLHDQPAIAALYNVGGGNLGLVEAVSESRRTGDVLVAGHEANLITVPLMLEGRMDFILAQDPSALLTQAVRQAQLPPEARTREDVLLDFAVYTRFNVPAFSRSA